MADGTRTGLHALPNALSQPLPAWTQLRHERSLALTCAPTCERRWPYRSIRGQLGATALREAQQLQRAPSGQLGQQQGSPGGPSQGGRSHCSAAPNAGPYGPRPIAGYVAGPQPVQPPHQQRPAAAWQVPQHQWDLAPQRPAVEASSAALLQQMQACSPPSTLPTNTQAHGGGGSTPMQQQGSWRQQSRSSSAVATAAPATNAGCNGTQPPSAAEAAEALAALAQWLGGSRGSTPPAAPAPYSQHMQAAPAATDPVCAPASEPQLGPCAGEASPLRFILAATEEWQRARQLQAAAAAAPENNRAGGFGDGTSPPRSVQAAHLRAAPAALPPAEAAADRAAAVRMLGARLAETILELECALAAAAAPRPQQCTRRLLPGVRCPAVSEGAFLFEVAVRWLCTRPCSGARHGQPACACNPLGTCCPGLQPLPCRVTSRNYASHRPRWQSASLLPLNLPPELPPAAPMQATWRPC